VATTRSSPTQSLLCNPIDDSALVLAEVVAFGFEPSIDLGFEPLEGVLIAAEQLSSDGIVCNIDR
jgi:hypothetical protein